jgi:general secretion pathway protein A
MYLENFGLKEYPFQQRYDKDYIFFSRSHEECLTRLLYTVNENKEASLLTGVHGTGKSLLLSMFREELIKNGYQVINMINSNLPPEQFLSEILWELGQKVEGLNKIEMLHLIHEIMEQNVQQDREMVLIVDEVQYVTDPTTFMEMHQLLNIRFEGKCPLSLILCGGNEVMHNLDKLGALAERLVIRSRLDILNINDTANYLQHRLKVAGATGPIFEKEAVEVLYRATHGVPRHINHMADLSLLIAASEGKKSVSGAVAQAAVNEWQGL